MDNLSKIQDTKVDPFKDGPVKPVVPAAPKLAAQTKVPEVKAQPLDFSKLSEQDVYNMNVPIPAIEHAVNDQFDVELKDSNYKARWVHQNSNRLGLMRQMGYTYVTNEELVDPTRLNIKEDENGQIKIIDTILMKCTKEKYFGALRSNHQRSLSLQNSKMVQSREQSRVRAMMEEVDPEFGDRVSAGQIGIF